MTSRVAHRRLDVIVTAVETARDIDTKSGKTVYRDADISLNIDTCTV